MIIDVIGHVTNYVVFSQQLIFQFLFPLTLSMMVMFMQELTSRVLPSLLLYLLLICLTTRFILLLLIRVLLRLLLPFLLLQKLIADAVSPNVSAASVLLLNLPFSSFFLLALLLQYLLFFIVQVNDATVFVLLLLLLTFVLLLKVFYYFKVFYCCCRCTSWSSFSYQYCSRFNAVLISPAAVAAHTDHATVAALLFQREDLFLKQTHIKQIRKLLH